MKKSSTLLIAVALILSACGTMTQVASTGNGQTYQDGIYSNTPAFRTRASKETAKASTDSLAEATRASMIYLFGEKKDTVMIPDNMSAMIRFDQKLGGTVVTVGENPYDWRYDLENNYGYYYGPYSIGSSWYWSRHYSPWANGSWYYGTGYYSPWRYSWHDPWYYGGYAGWYDPWYMGWYDPWYYGGWYSAWDPWYRHNYWHNYYYYAGWYGGWDPYWGHHHHHHHGVVVDPHHKDRWHGTRGTTGSDRVFTSNSSLRGGIGSRSTVSRNATVSADRTTVTRGSSSTGRVTAARRVSPAGKTGQAVSASSASTVQRNTVARTTPGTSVSRATTPSANHRRPATAQGSKSYNIGSSSSSSSSSSSVSFDRNSEIRPSSSYNRSSSSSSQSTRSSYTPSTSSTRSSFSTGGGATRSGGSFSGGSSGGGASRSGGGASRSGGGARR